MSRSSISHARFVLCALATLLLSGCQLPQFDPSGPKTVASTDGLAEVTLPSGWSKATDLHKEAELQVANSSDKCFLVVLSEPKTDFDDIDYHGHSDLTRNSFVKNIKKGSVTAGPKEMEINGRKAVQYEIQGVAESVKVAYLHTTVDGDERFHQVLAWTLRSRIDANRGQLEAVVNSFREISSPHPVSPKP